MSGGGQNWVGRNRPPRVQIEYEVHLDGGMKKVELPFVMGVMGDFAGDPRKPLEDLEDRKFINIDRDNFNDVMKRIKPRTVFKVENTMAGDKSEFLVDLEFEHISELEPGAIVKKVKPLNDLLETRNKLRDLLTTSDRTKTLEKALGDALQNPEQLAALAAELGSDESDGADDTEQQDNADG